MLIKLADLRWRQVRRPVLVGKVGQHWLMIVQRNQIGINGEAATLFIGPESTAGADNKPLPPIWDAQNAKWIGPASSVYPGFYDDSSEFVRDLMGGKT
jgi:hypothetical protein